MTAWAQKYIGMRFVDKGRDRSGVDCWGLIYVAFRDEKKIEIEKYSDIGAKQMLAIARKMAVAKDADPWMNIGDMKKMILSPLRAFDVVVMWRHLEIEKGKMEYVPLHVGLMVDDRRMLHIEERHDSVCLPITHPDVRFRIEGFYRHRELL